MKDKLRDWLPAILAFGTLLIIMLIIIVQPRWG